MGVVDTQEIRKAVLQLKNEGELFEVRIITASKKILSGYFREVDKLISALSSVDLREANVYITLNKIQEALYSRAQSNKFLLSKQSTNDKEVEGYRWLFLDFDPVRISGISSSEEELHKAYDLANKVYQYMKRLGFEEPVKAISGNGAHLLYKIGLANNEENQKLVEGCLKALSFIFDNDDVKVDTANFNPSRICKLYGTMAQKGSNTPERPHRMSRLIGEVREIKATNRIFLEKLASQGPKAEQIKPARYNNYTPSEFDIAKWLDAHGLEYTTKQWNECTKYVLSRCPFDENHKAPDSCIIKQHSGAIGFKCLHNSCQGKTWQDVRLMFEPDAYEIKAQADEMQNGWKEHKKNADIQIDYAPPTEETKPMFATVKMILAEPDKEETFIPTGIEKVDAAIRGLGKGKISLLSGLRGAAKSTLLNQIILEARKGDYNTICYSGELTNRNFVSWLNLQAAGKNWTRESAKWPGYYFVKQEAVEPIASWLGEKVWIYNNDYGNNFVKIRDSLEVKIAECKADLVILDNLMAMNILDLSKDKYEAQSAFVNVLADTAKRTNTHIMFVAHPRKAQGFLRLDDVSGTGDLSNRVDYAFIIHRNNLDFANKTHDMFGWKDDNPVYAGTNVIEVCKDRDGGTQDLFVPLFFERESKRLKNSADEYKEYGWKEPNNGFVDADVELPWR